MPAPRSLIAVLALVLALPAAGRAADLDPYLPVDTTSYVHVNVRQIVDSPLFKTQLLGVARGALKELGEVQDILTDLGFDPFKDLDRVIISGPGGTETDRGLIIARGKFDVVKFTRKADEAARDNSDFLKIHKVPLGAGKTHPVYEVVIPNQDVSLFVAIADNKTILASPGKDYIVDALRADRDKKKPALKNKDLQALIERLDPKLGLSLAVLGKPLARAAADSELLPALVTDALNNVEAIGGGISITNEVRLDLVVAGKDERSAKSVRDGMERMVDLAKVGLALVAEDRKELGVVRDILKTVNVGGKGKIISVSARLTADVLDEFLKK